MSRGWTKATRTLGRLSAALCLVSAGFWPARAQSDISIPPGIYSNVDLSAATGDLAGVEIEIHRGAGRIVDVTICEGWCNWAYQVAYESNGGWATFEILERPDDPPRKFRMKRQGSGVLVEEDGEFFVRKDKLKRLKERFGLDVADDSMRDYAERTKSP